MSHTRQKLLVLTKHASEAGLQAELMLNMQCLSVRPC